MSYFLDSLKVVGLQELGQGGTGLDLLESVRLQDIKISLGKLEGEMKVRKHMATLRVVNGVLIRLPEDAVVEGERKGCLALRVRVRKGDLHRASKEGKDVVEVDLA
jgi:hypothetical protein